MFQQLLGSVLHKDFALPAQKCAIDLAMVSYIINLKKVTSINSHGEFHYQSEKIIRTQSKHTTHSPHIPQTPLWRHTIS